MLTKLIRKRPKCDTQLFTCPISKMIMHSPVTADDGFTYEHQMIMHAWNSSQISPMTHAPMRGVFYENRIIKQLIEAHIETYPDEKSLQYVPFTQYDYNKHIILDHITLRQWNKLLDYTEYKICDVIDNVLTKMSSPFLTHLIQCKAPEFAVSHVLENNISSDDDSMILSNLLLGCYPTLIRKYLLPTSILTEAQQINIFRNGNYDILEHFLNIFPSPPVMIGMYNWHIGIVLEHQDYETCMFVVNQYFDWLSWCCSSSVNEHLSKLVKYDWTPTKSLRTLKLNARELNMITREWINRVEQLRYKYLLN